MLMTDFNEDLASSGNNQKETDNCLFNDECDKEWKENIFGDWQQQIFTALCGNKNLPGSYENLKNAWMISKLFSRCHLKQDKFLIVKQKVLLILDNCGTHLLLKVVSVDLCFLSPDITAILQPFD